jgi:hypothetical protein
MVWRVANGVSFCDVFVVELDDMVLLECLFFLSDLWNVVCC